MKLQNIRTHALALEAVTEEPHHHFSSFRVHGKIFVTIPPGGEAIRVFLGDDDRDRALAIWPDFVQTLTWGGKAVGVRVQLASANPAAVTSLVNAAYQTRVRKDARPKTPRKPMAPTPPAG